MAQLDAKARGRLPRSAFAYLDSKGGEHLPIHDEDHVRNAIARFNQTEFESAAAKNKAGRAVLAAAKRHGIEVDPDDEIRRPAHHRADADPTTPRDH